ncbi:MAG: UDP-2,3-diacylglucosamine diphosphatase LpxI, partial [Pseudomonadota bacterium]
MSGSTLGILSGSGSLPIEIAKSLEQRDLPFHLIGLRGVANVGIEAFPHSWTGLGQVGRMLRLMRQAGCDRLLIIGGLVRPNVWQLRPDLGFFQNLPTIANVMRGGDDAVLRRVIAFFERQGLSVVGVRDVAPELIVPDGPIVGAALNEPELGAVSHAANLLDSTARFDMGQAAIATPDGVVGIEDGGGTARLLQSSSASAGPPAARVLVKRTKTGQDLRVDLPTIGPDTISQADDAGIAAIAVSAGEALIAERAKTIAAARDRDIKIVGIGPPPRATRHMSIGAEARTCLMSVKPLGPDAERALGITLVCWPQIDGDDIGTYVNKGHAKACLAGGLRNRTWGPRLAALDRPQSHWVRRRRRGV